jgi:hypothetical protein
MAGSEELANLANIIYEKAQVLEKAISLFNF